MMMGTADEIVKAPEKGPVFMEDLPEEEQVVAVVRFLGYVVSHMGINGFSSCLGHCYVLFIFLFSVTRVTLLVYLIWETLAT